MPESPMTFHLIYDGEDLTSGSMDARDLAPALIAFADLADSAARVVSPEAPSMTVRVKADLRRGSFDIALEMSNRYDQFIGLFSSTQMQAWGAVLSLLGISGTSVFTGVFQLIKKSKGKKPRVVSIERSEKVTITLDGEGELEIPTEVWQLFNNPTVRDSAERIVAPLKSPGVEDLKLKTGGKTVLEVTKDEVPYFRAPERTEDEMETETPGVRLLILAPQFNRGNKWKLDQGNGPFWANISDEAFVSSVDSGREAFRKGDVMVVDLHTKQWFDGISLKNEYTITRVIQHISRIDQAEIDLSSDEDPDERR